MSRTVSPTGRRSSVLPLTRRRHAILHVLAPAEIVGMESIVTMLAAAQRGAGHAVRLAVIVAEDGEERSFVAHAGELGLDVVTLVVPQRAPLRQRRVLADVCSSFQATVVHSHSYHADMLVAALPERDGPTTVSTVHGFNSGGWRNRVFEHLQRRVFRRFDAVVAVSGRLAAQLEGATGTPEQLHIACNGYSAPQDRLSRAAAAEALSLKDGGFEVGWVGALSFENGADLLISSLPYLADLPLRASIIGDGAEHDSLRDLASMHGVDKRITWHTNIPRAARLLPAFDVVVLSSRNEGTPPPPMLLEGMAAGVPIVATRVSGVADVFGPDEALLVPLENPAELAAAIRRVYNDPLGAARRAAAARARLAREFTLESWLEAYDSIYQKAASRRAGKYAQ
jgi:glycogen synthase